MIEYDPKLETFFVGDDNASLNITIKQMVQDLSDEYIYSHNGMKPSKEVLENWLRRLKRSYYKCEVIRYDVY